MFKRIRLWAVVLAISLLACAFTLPICAQMPPPSSLSAQSAVLIEAEGGTVVYEKAAHTRLPMASTTKIMTALVALDLASPDTKIAVDARAVGTEGSSVYLCEGETLTLESLLYALMLESANDAAVAIAIGVAGSEESFVEAMNAKANALGLMNTHFVNPHGLDGEEHYTTAYELALLARVALRHPLLKAIASTRKITIPCGETDEVRLLVNHNKMLRQYEGCIGVKTGYTKASGRCLVSAAERDGVVMIAVTLDSPDDWNDHTKLLDYGFANYHRLELCPANFQFCLPVVGGKESYAILGVEQAFSLTLPQDVGVIESILECPRYLFATVSAGDICGKIVFLCDTNGDGIRERVGEVPLIAQYDVAKHSPRLTLWQRFLLWWQKCFG